MAIQYDYDLWRTVRFEKDTRYYELLLEQDLFSNWVVTKINGGINSQLGKMVHFLCDSYEEACNYFEELSEYRIKKRRYRLVHTIAGPENIINSG